jgi:hypothetical protein
LDGVTIARRPGASRPRPSLGRPLVFPDIHRCQHQLVHGRDEQTRQYLDDAEQLLKTPSTATGYFNAMVERYPGHLGRLILWVTARALYGVREHPGANLAQIILSSWL